MCVDYHFLKGRLITHSKSSSSVWLVLGVQSPEASTPFVVNYCCLLLGPPSTIRPHKKDIKRAPEVSTPFVCGLDMLTLNTIMVVLKKGWSLTYLCKYGHFMAYVPVC
jgi:hypothetical protein